MREATDARRFLALYARLGREMYARAGALLPILLEPAARDFADRIERERLKGTTMIAAILVERFALRPGLSASDAADVLWTLTAPELQVRLVRRRGWSLQRYEAWLATTMANALLPGAPT
ncbi:hypothetical protein [Dactylosporangium matsuzakiense]|uniref:TetR family transcriptional regulator n=1 Tax=Dactylosporangium matsuzakiense TaxID=53360 RepID=A0A9W6KSB9_9ACTN|nr:hypothetical protein [Dactylosporangium matsuzakiense]GLL04614.1 hypothetical protein GCM10017581_063610 [Dactylosporangium matsuzakiense]